MEILFYLAGVAVAVMLYDHFVRASATIAENVADFREALRTMLFLKVEEVRDPQSDKTIYLAFDLKTNRFMGQDFAADLLYRSLFERSPEVTMLWVHTKDTGDNMIRVDKDQILVDTATV
jgi:hypothetical protein